MSTKNLVPSQRSSANPAPPQTMIPESIVPVIPQPTSAPLGWLSAGFSGRGRGLPGAGVSSAIGSDTISRVSQGFPGPPPETEDRLCGRFPVRPASGAARTRAHSGA